MCYFDASFEAQAKDVKFEGGCLKLLFQGVTIAGHAWRGEITAKLDTKNAMNIQDSEDSVLTIFQLPSHRHHEFVATHWGALYQLHLILYSPSLITPYSHLSKLYRPSIQ